MLGVNYCHYNPSLAPATQQGRSRPDRIGREVSMNDERAANAVDRRLGQRVRTRRLEIGMSQERLAEILGVTFQQVQKYEKGVNRIAASRLFDISSALDMPIARFFEGIGSARRGGVA